MFEPKQTTVDNRQMKVQKLSVPFLITANASPANKSIVSDAEDILFFNTEGLDRITPALASGEVLPAGALTPGPAAPAGLPALGTSSLFAILGASAITGSAGAGSVITGDMGIYPNNSSSITNFPPSTVSGTVYAADAVAIQAQLDALAAYTDMTTRSTTVIASDLGGQTLTAGNYSFASGAATLAASGAGTLTISGSGVVVIKTASTLGTGAGGLPTIAFTNGATPANLFWVIGSSATLNIGVTAAGATFYGTMIAYTSITVTQPGSVSGRLLALNGAVTLSGTNDVSLPSGGVGANNLSDALGNYTVLCKIREPLFKVMSVRLTSRNAVSENQSCEIVGLTEDRQGILANIRSAHNISTTNEDATLEFDYVVAPR